MTPLPTNTRRRMVERHEGWEGASPGLLGRIFDLPDGDDGSPLRLVTENAADNATVTECLIDGEESDRDRKTLRPVGLRMMARGARLAGVA